MAITPYDTNMLQSPLTLPEESMSGFELDQSKTSITPLHSLSSMGSFRKASPLTPRRSITPRQAIDDLELSSTQANDIQHVFEKYLLQIDQHAANIRQDINAHFADIIKRIMKREEKLLHQV